MRRKSYRFILSKLSFHSVKAITLHRESYAFTEVGEQNGQDKPCFSYFYSGNSSGSRFFVDKISKAKSPKCPILCTYVITPFIIVSMSCLLWLLLFVKRWLRSWHEVEYCFLQGVILRKIFFFRYLGEVFVFILQKQFITLCVSILYLLN